MPKVKASAATFEVFEMFTGRREFWWYVKDADGEVIDAWNANLRYDEKAETMVGSRAFATEEQARAYIGEKHPTATDFHSTRDDLKSETAVAKAHDRMVMADDPVDFAELERIRQANLHLDAGKD